MQTSFISQQWSQSQWLRDALITFATPTCTGDDRAKVITAVRKWLNQQWFPFVDGKTIAWFCHVVMSMRVNRIDRMSLKNIFASLEAQVRQVVVAVVSLLKEMDDGGYRVNEMIGMLEDMMFDCWKGKGDSNVSTDEPMILVKLVKMDIGDIRFVFGDDEEMNVDELKDKVKGLESKVELLEKELERVRTESENKWKEVSSSFDFWAKLVLSELHTEGSANAAVRAEFDNRIRLLEEECVGKCGNAKKKGKGKKGRKKCIVTSGKIWGSAVNRERNYDGGWREELRDNGPFEEQGNLVVEQVGQQQPGDDTGYGGKSHIEGDRGNDYQETFQDSLEGEDHELMQAFRKALGSHFSPEPRPDTRIFQNGKWISLA